jgi:hypothetical protein
MIHFRTQLNVLPTFLESSSIPICQEHDRGRPVLHQSRAQGLEGEEQGARGVDQGLACDLGRIAGLRQRESHDRLGLEFQRRIQKCDAKIIQFRFVPMKKNHFEI